MCLYSPDHWKLEVDFPEGEGSDAKGRLLSLKGACEIEKSVQITCMQVFELHWIVTANKKNFINDFFFC